MRIENVANIPRTLRTSILYTKSKYVMLYYLTDNNAVRLQRKSNKQHNSDTEENAE